MTDRLNDRLNQILPRVTSQDFLGSRGLGNEIAFYIFEYPPEEELQIREHIGFLLEHIPKQRQGLKVTHINLLDLVVSHLEDRRLLTKAIEIQKTKGDAFVLKQLQAVLDPDKLKHVFAAAAHPEDVDLVLVSGIGSVYPMLRPHTLLNNLHSIMGQTPMVMFYPGKYDGQALRLFGKLKSPTNLPIGGKAEGGRVC